MAASFEDLMVLLGLLAEASGESVSPLRLEFTAKTLFPLGAREVCATLERMLQSARRFPTVSEVKAEMGMSELTHEDEARMIVERIAKAVGMFGEIPPGNQKTPGAVRIAIGEAAWDAVGKSGGWNALISRFGENEMATRAQLRDIVSVYLRTGQLERGTLPEAISASAALSESVKQWNSALPESRMTPEERSLLEARIVDLKKQRADLVLRNEQAIEIVKKQLDGRRDDETL